MVLGVCGGVLFLHFIGKLSFLYHYARRATRRMRRRAISAWAKEKHVLTPIFVCLHHSPPSSFSSIFPNLFKLIAAISLGSDPVPCHNRNVPGVSLYFLTLSRLRTFVGQTHSTFLVAPVVNQKPGGKIKLTTAGDLFVGSTARTGVGFLLMPFTLLKTISEVCPSFS